MLSLRKREAKYPHALRCFAIIFMALLLSFGSVLECYAAVDDFIDSYVANDIRFHNPDDCRTTDGSASTLATGDTARAMIWNYFIAKGFNDIAAAGLVGNAVAESGASPTRASGSVFWGIFQWGNERRIALQDKVRAAGLEKYLDSSYWPQGADESIPKDDYRKLVQIELDHAMSENDGDWQGEIKKATSAEEAAEIFLVLFERAINGEEPILYYTDSRYYGELYQGTETRREQAVMALQEFSGAGPSAGSSGGLKVIDGSNLVWIGDSLSVNLEGTGGGKNYFKENIPQALYSVQGSKQFHFDTDVGGESGLNILKSYKDSDQLRDVLVFALGTNDTGSVTAENIKKVVDLAENTKLIVFVTNYTTTKDYSNNNRAMKAAALEYDNVVVADWANAVSGKASTHLATDGVHLTEEGKELFFTTIMAAINGATDGVIPEECCDTAPVKSSERTFKGTTYQFTDGQLRGMVAMISKENGNSVSQVKTQAAQMANRFEKYGKDYGTGATGIIKYVQDSGWYDAATGAAYDEAYNAREEYFKAVEDVLVSGNRPIPQEVVEYATADAQHISVENNGVSFDVSDRSQYKSGSTRIIKNANAGGGSWIFYAWADEGAKTGDLFGYLKSDPPSGNGTAAESADACCESSAGVTTATINGYKYAFPLAGATKANYLNPGGEVLSVLSRIPCGSLDPQACHHSYHAVDMGLRMKMVKGGKDPVASDFIDCSVDAANCLDDELYYSVGATVVAPIAGTITNASHHYGTATGGYEDKCGSVTLRGEDGNAYWLGHLSASSISVEEGATVSAGDKLAEVGLPQCAQGTQAHLHIDNYSIPNQTSPTSWTVELMDKLWEFLPDADSGTGVEKCESNGLKVGGLSFEEAEALMEEYRALGLQVYRNGQTSIDVNGRYFTGAICSEGLMFNCVAFSRYFIFKYVNAPEAAYENLGDGHQVVNSLVTEAGFKFGTEPRPYAIFSWSDGSFGHTGVVLGVIDSDTFITGEASCTYGSSGTGAFKRSLSDGHNWSFAYTDGMISGL